MCCVACLRWVGGLFCPRCYNCSLQEEPSYEKIKGENNPADGLTKHVRQELAEKYAKVVGTKLRADRAKGSLQLAGGT